MFIMQTGLLYPTQYYKYPSQLYNMIIISSVTKRGKKNPFDPTFRVFRNNIWPQKSPKNDTKNADYSAV